MLPFLTSYRAIVEKWLGEGKIEIWVVQTTFNPVWPIMKKSHGARRAADE